MSQTQYFSELQQIILSVPQVSIKQYLEQKQMFGKDVSLFYDEIEYLKQAETSILQLKDISLYLGNKVVEVRKQHNEEIEYLEAEIMQAKEEISEQKQKLQEYYQIYQNMEEKNFEYQKQIFELEEKCDKYLQKLTNLYQTMEALAEQQRTQSQNLSKKNAYASMQQINDDQVVSNLNRSISQQTLGNIQQIDEQFNFNCNSCAEKQIMIETLQQEIDEMNSEKKGLKEQIFTIKSQLEILKKRNVELEKQYNNVSILEKYSSVQKQRLKIQQNKAQLQQQYLNSTDKGLSPSSVSINNNTLEDEHYTLPQSENYQNLLDELNQIKLRSMNINFQSTLTEFNNSIQQDMNSFSDFCSTNNDLYKKFLDCEPVSSFNYEVQQQNNLQQPNIKSEQYHSKITCSTEKNSPKVNKKPRLSLFKRNMISDDTNLQYFNKSANQAQNEKTRVRKSDSVYQYRSPEQKRDGYQKCRHKQVANSQPNKIPSQNLINSIDEKNESLSSNQTNKNKSELNSFLNLNSLNENQIAQFLNNGIKTTSNTQNQLENQKSISQLKSISEFKNSTKNSKKRSEPKLQQPLIEDLKNLINLKDQQSFMSLTINSQRGTQSDLYQKEEITNRQNKKYEDVLEEEEEKKDVMNSDQNIQSLDESEEFTHQNYLNSMDLIVDQKKSISELNTEQYIQDPTQNSLHFVKNFDQQESAQNTQKNISSQNTNQVFEEKIQNDTQSNSFIKEQKIYSQKCIIPLPKQTRGIIYKIIQWLIFLILIPISFVFDKPSFLKQQEKLKQ